MVLNAKSYDRRAFMAEQIAEKPLGQRRVSVEANILWWRRLLLYLYTYFKAVSHFWRLKSEASIVISMLVTI